MNSKSQIPEAVLILIALVVCGTTLYYIVTYGTIKAETININKSIDIFNEAEKFDYYIRDFSDMALQESYAEVTKKPLVCQEQIGTVAIWSEKCKPNNQEIKNKIKLKFDEKLSKIGKLFSSEIKEKINVKFEPIIFNNSNKNKFVSYNISYTLFPSFSLDYPKIDFEEIYSAIITKKVECENKDNQQECMQQLNFENWNFRLESSTNYYLFTLYSKKSYFYDNSFKPVEFSFAIKK
ncbi:MAG: hypothetical protein QW041_01290 [Candidatus Pacearchaeota archaeon]